MPTAPPTRCARVDCYEMATKRGLCDGHQPEPWRGRPAPSKRYGMSSGTMRSLKRRVAMRDYGCCYVCGGEDADELEHIVPVSQGGAARDLDNLGLIHSEPCHREKTAREALEGSRRAREIKTQSQDRTQ
ncbi:HNH endonuclease [Streptomyces sp. NBC_01775]|uniref:HNH endonuclease n=1 Tax=Streptomyces sp. NBC_01775 TaxID=2975939 RepID=UPI002DDAF518|nr:HNH endonuclease signature motif containing protein [Streptomyces sp. NBC_01775]